MLRTPSFDIVIQRSAKVVDRGQQLQFDVTLVPLSGADDVSLSIDATPRSNGAQPIRLPVRADDLHHYTASGTFPERGTWDLSFSVGLQNGHSESAQFPLRITDPNGFDPALAWLIGFSPLIALGGFAISEAARAHRMAGRRERYAANAGR